MSRRLVVITEIIAPYRIPVFNALARETGIDLHVIFLCETDPGLRNWQVYKTEISFSYQILPSWRRRFGSKNLLLNRGLAAALKQASPDVIVCGGYNYISSWQARNWAQRKGVPFLLWIESTLMDQRRQRAPIEYLKKMFLKGCDAFVVPGKSSREYVRSFGISDEFIFVAPNAVANQIFQNHSRQLLGRESLERRQRGLPEQYILFVGRLVREKGIVELVQAFSELKDSDPKLGLVIVGDGPCRSDVERIASLTAPGRVKMTGFVQRDELAAYYALAEAFVLPTHTDTWGMVVNEAMACGLPVIASRVAGCVADLVHDNWNGLTVEPQNSSELRRAIGALLADPESRATMGRRSVEIISGYTPEHCAAGIAVAALQCGTSARTLAVLGAA